MSSPQVQRKILQPGDRRYTIATPAGYTGDQPAPLILALHYGGTVTPFYGEGLLTSLVEPGLRELGAIIVAPDCTGSKWTHSKSEADVLALLVDIHATYNVNAHKTLITGYSMGGRGAWYLAARYQERFTAALVMAGEPQPDSVDVQWNIPLYVIHARQDQVIPLEPTEVAVTQLKAKGVPVELVVLEGITHYETHRFVAPLRAAIPWIRTAWQ